MDLVTTTAVSSPVVVALVGVLRKAGLPDHLAPIAAVLIGMVVELGASYGTRHPMARVEIAGLLLGLAASGLYSSGKTMGGKIASVRPWGKGAGLWLGESDGRVVQGTVFAGGRTPDVVPGGSPGDPTNSSGASL